MLKIFSGLILVHFVKLGALVTRSSPLFSPEEEDARVAAILDHDPDFNRKHCIICCLQFSILPFFSDQRSVKCDACKFLVCHSCFVHQTATNADYRNMCRHCAEKRYFNWTTASQSSDYNLIFFPEFTKNGKNLKINI